MQIEQTKASLAFCFQAFIQNVNPECEASTSRFTIQQHINDQSLVCQALVDPGFWGSGF